MRVSGLSSWLTPYPCWAYTGWCSHTYGGSHMDRLVLDHFQLLVVILYNNMPSVEVGVEFLQTEAY